MSELAEQRCVGLLRSMQRDAQALRESKELEADDRNRLIGDLGNLLTALEELERLTGVRDNPQVLENWYELLADVLTASFHVGRVAGLLDGAANEREKQTAAMRDAKSKNKKIETRKTRRIKSSRPSSSNSESRLCHATRGSSSPKR